MKTLNVVANLNQLDTVLAFVDEHLEENDCPLATQMQIELAVEEIFVNIAHYAYHPIEGEATVSCEICKDPLSVTIQFLDNGTSYNPLNHTDPDITLSALERDIGGLGVLLVKQVMDDVQYEYQDGKNILTMKKRI